MVSVDGGRPALALSGPVRRYEGSRRRRRERRRWRVRRPLSALLGPLVQALWWPLSSHPVQGAWAASS